MKLKTVAAFPIPVAYGSLGDEAKELNSLLLADIHSEVATKTELRSGVGVHQTQGMLEQCYNSFAVLQKTINSIASGIFKTNFRVEDDLIACDFWANYNPGNPVAYHMPHSHSVDGFMFTGVYFPHGLDTEPVLCADSQPKPGSLVLLDPIENIKSAISHERTMRYPYFGIPLSLQPTAGAFIIFPSYLSHMVTPTENTEPRYSIAYNFFVKN